MRIAISGTHRSGKSTLAEDLGALLQDHVVACEPYHAMAEDGYPFSHPPSLEDFEAQLEHSLASLNDRAPNVIFDRCPVDFLGYLSVHDDADRFDADAWLPRVRAAVRTLDLIVFVPIEAVDRIVLSASDDDDEELRAEVDEELRRIWLDDPFDLAVDVIEVEGAPHRRISTVMERIQSASRRS
jgi:hypothetical protein